MFSYKRTGWLLLTLFAAMRCLATSSLGVEKEMEQGNVKKSCVAIHTCKVCFRSIRGYMHIKLIQVSTGNRVDMTFTTRS